MGTETSSNVNPEVYEFPASSTQASLWVIHQMMPQNSAYNIPLLVKISGDLNVPALEKSVKTLVQRHEIFRTRYVDNDGELVQHIYPEIDIDFSIVDDLAEHNTNNEEIAQAAEELVVTAIRKNFDLANGDILRAGIILTGEKEYLFYFVIHHIAVDHGGMLLISNEISKLYKAFAKGLDPALPEPDLQYADYVMWLQENQAEEQQKVEAWRQHLDGVSGTLILPTDRRRPAIPSGVGAEHRFQLAPELSEKVIRFSRAQGLTLYVTCLAAFKVLMARYSNQQDVVVGTPFSFRGEQEELQEVVGCILNTLPLASVITKQKTFNELLASIKKTMLFAYENQDVPFDKIVNAVLKVRDFSSNPLFQVGFVFQEPPPVLELEGLQCELRDVHTGGAMYDIHQWMWQQDDILHGVIWYSSDIYDIETIKRMQAAYEMLLDTLIDAPDNSVWQAGILADTDKALLDELAPETSDTLLNSSSHESVSVTTPFPSLFSSQAPIFGDRIAAVFSDGVKLTYTELEEKSNQLANFLVAQGVQSGDFVGICMTRTQHMLVALIAVMKSSAVYVPLDPAYPVDRLQFMLETSAAKLLLANTAAMQLLTPDMIANSAVTVTDIEAQWSSLDTQSTQFTSLAEPDHLAYVIFTSGSTGKPKGVQVLHSGVANLLQAMRIKLGCTEDNRLLAVTTLSFDIAVVELFLPLLCGACVVVADTEQASDSMLLKQLIDEHKINMMDATPVTWRGLVAADFVGGKDFIVLCGGEPFPEDLARELVQRCGHVWNGYGPTETTVYSTAYRLPPSADPILIGHPVANTQCYVLDEMLQRVPVGVAGELYIGGRGVTKGYLGRPDLTEERFIANPFSIGSLYRTGDLVRVTGSGEIMYLTRIDNQVKVRGFRIELGEIEAQLSKHSSITHAVVNVCKFSEMDQRLVAYVVLKNGSALDEKALLSHLRDSLPDYMLPQTIMALESFPETASGKIDRNALPKPVWRDEQNLFVAPQTPTAKAITQIWSELLAVDDASLLGLNSDFFSLGGHSLLAVSMLLNVNKRFDSDIRVRDFITNPTIENIVSLVDSGQGQDAMVLLSDIERPELLPMSNAQRRLWYIEQFTEKFSIYNVPLTYDVDGLLDERLVKRSLCLIAARHESLRTALKIDGQDWVQHIDNPVSEQDIYSGELGDGKMHFGWCIDDVSGLSSDEQEKSLAQKEYDYSRCPFNFETGPLWCAELTVISPNHSRLFFVFHHVIFDGISADVFVDEFVAIYQALERDERPQLEVIPYHFVDYVLWQQLQNQTDLIQQQYSYWKQKLGGELPVLSLPADFARPAEFDYLGDTCQMSLNAELIADLNAVANRAHCSLFVVLLATYQLLLAKYTQQDDLLVGCPIAERGQSEFAGTMGFLVSTVVLRTQLSEFVNFDDLLENVRNEWHEAIAHGDVSFDDLVDQLQPIRDASHSPIFQTMFSYQNIDRDVISFTAKEDEQRSMALRRPKHTTARTDVTFWLEHCSESIEINCEYSTSIFSRQFATQFLSSYQGLLEQIAASANTSKKIADLTAVSPTQANDLHRFRGTLAYQATEPDVLSDLIHHQAVNRADQIAVCCGTDTLSYAELEKQSNQLAAYLIDCGIERGDFVAFAMNRNIDLLVGLLGMLKAGAAYVPLDPDYPKDRLAYMLEAAQVKLLLTESSLIDDLPGFKGKTVCLDQCQSALAEMTDQIPAIKVDKDDIAYVIFTSGSTGQPKGVKVPHVAIMNFLNAMVERPGFSSTDKLLAVTTLSFDIAVLELFLPLFAGGTVVLASREQATDASSLSELISQHQITVMQATPSTWRMLLESAWVGQPSLKVLCGGEAFPQDMAEQLFPLVGSIWNMYGPTETTVWSTCFEITDPQKPVYIGKPIRNTSCYVLDKDLNPVPPGVVGELYIGGEGVTKGYLGRDDLTEQQFPLDPFVGSVDASEVATENTTLEKGQPKRRMYRTGDKVRWRYDGELEYFNRIDSQVKVRGFRIELAEIETQLLKHEAINDGVVVLQEVDGGARLVAYYTVKQSSEVSAMQLRQFLNQILPRYMLPNHFVQEQELPLTPSGKIDRKTLSQRSGNNLANVGGSFKAPDSVTEKYYASIWQELLMIDKVSLDDNFFDIGGHSLMATRVATRVNVEKGVNIQLRSLLMNTLEQIAQQYPISDSVDEELGQLSTKENYKLGESSVDKRTEKPSGFIHSMKKLFSK